MTYRLNASIDPKLRMIKKEWIICPVHKLLVLDLSVPPAHRIVEPCRFVNVTIFWQPLQHVRALRKWSELIVALS